MHLPVANDFELFLHQIPWDDDCWTLRHVAMFRPVMFVRIIVNIADNRETSNISRTLIANKIVGHSDVVGASSVGAAPTTSSFSTEHLASMDWAITTARRNEKHLRLGIWCDLY